MKSDEDRIQEIEKYANGVETYAEEAIARALCEVARQLSRLADAYEEANK